MVTLFVVYRRLVGCNQNLNSIMINENLFSVLGQTDCFYNESDMITWVSIAGLTNPWSAVRKRRSGASSSHCSRALKDNNNPGGKMPLKWEVA